MVPRFQAEHPFFDRTALERRARPRHPEPFGKGVMSASSARG